MKWNNNTNFLFFLSVVFLVYSCTTHNEKEYKYNEGRFPEIPKNLSDFNTRYDDYNSTAPSLGGTFPFCFSSNRNSHGNDFDIIYKLMTIDFSKTTGLLRIYNNTSNNLDVYIENTTINNALKKINTSANEFGPYLIYQGTKPGASNINNRYESYIFLYSCGIDGSQDVMFTHNLYNEDFVDPVKVDFINSEFNDAYPTFNSNFSKIYFSSDRSGVYDIYYNDVDSSKEIIDILTETVSNPVKDTILSSDFDDKCPFILRNLMVFASNRSGGYGGYDLYYSVFVNGNWTEPVNFGSKINTSYDEYRPIVKKEYGFTNDLMIFSSNRPGGKGGFDLYYVGISINR